ncbi:TPA: glycoprotein 3, partial [Escherichia coli]
MSDNTIPEYLQPALAQLEKARAAHLENARLMDETVTAIERAEQEKNALTQADGNDADDWRTAFRAAGGVLSDELKQRHIERVARRELVQEYDNLAVVLNFERERLKGACDSTATAYRKAHHHLLSLYAEHELEHALNETCEALVRAMHLSILVQENPLANTTGHQGYVAPEKAVMQQVKSSLEQKIKQMQISLSGEPVL